jgi:beta-lactamase class A
MLIWDVSPSLGSLQQVLAPIAAATPARLGISLMDLKSSDSLGYRSSEKFPAASIIKLPILLELYRCAQAGKTDLAKSVVLARESQVGGAGVLFELTPGLELNLEDLARLMMVVSDNTASNLLIDELGFEAINAFMQSQGMSGTHLGRYFMETPTPERDNRACAVDFSRCLAALWKGEVLNPGYTQRALAILSRQQYREKIPLLLPESVVVYHKTGELDGVRHDCGIVAWDDQAFALTLLTADGGAPWEVDRAMADLSRACFDFFNSNRL